MTSRYEMQNKISPPNEAVNKTEDIFEKKLAAESNNSETQITRSKAIND